MRALGPLRYKTLSLVAFLGIETITLLAGTAAVAAFTPTLTNRTPDKESSYTAGGEDGIHVFLLRISKEQGVQRQIDLAAYFKSDPGNNTYLTFSPGASTDASHVCSTYNGYKGALSAQAENQYLTVTMTAYGGGTTNYFIKRSDACRQKNGTNNQNHDPTNAFYARYKIPDNIGSPDPQTGRYKVTVNIKLHDDIPKPDTVGESDILQQRLIVWSDAGQIGPLGGNTRSFPIVVDWNKRDTYWQGRIEIPFGLPCTVKNNQDGKVGVYDADNGDPSGPTTGFSPREVIFAVFRVPESGGAWERVNLQSPNSKSDRMTSYNLDGTSGHAIRPIDGTSELAEATITMNPAYKYKMVIIGIAPRNTIDIKIPEDTIFGDLRCGWNIRPDSIAVPSIQQPNGTVTFTHTATNTGAFISGNVTSRVKWGKDGVLQTGTIRTDANNTYNPNNNTVSRQWSNSFTIPSGAANGDLYCQYIEVQPRSDLIPGLYDSWIKGDRACVTVDRQTGDRFVNIQPVVNGLMEYIEPTETAKFDGYVNVNGFPRLWDDEWGYTEVAKQRPAQRVTATSSGNELQVDGPYFTSMVQTSPGSTTYYCPHGNDTKISQSTCRHDRPSYTTKAGCEAAGFTWSNGSCKSFHSTSSSYTPPTYACPATYQPISSSTCWRYRYKCSYDSTWGAWNGSAPSCMSYWTCPGGAAGSGWGYSAPTCQGWRCQYAPYTQVNQATAPPCEYRCTDGTGDRARQSNGWTGDMNCYMPPSFTLTCFWKNKPAFSQTVSDNGRYCDNRDMDADEGGVTIGTPVRAVLTANYPGTNAWSFPPPGYKINMLETRWGWDNFPSRSAEDTVRVVAKPTVKIRGGDVAAGGRFKDVNNCNLVSTFSTVGGWPHSPDYNASGTEFAATASGNVWGFATATHRGTPRSTPPSALAFSNTSLPSGDHFGRQFTSRMPCIYDHYGMKPATLPSLDLNNITGAESGSYTGTGGQISNNPILQPGKRVTVYVDGNVYISNQNIRYNRSAPWTKTQDIPGFKLVVRGNIYIAPSVRELNGIYVAQPTSPTSTTTGNIYTCATATAPVSPTSRYGTCNTDLTVNGTFLARKVYLDRTQGTAIRGETAEYFNYLPELWLTDWETTDSSSELKYDSIISLPPVL